jgi:hypothetical protein
MTNSRSSVLLVAVGFSCIACGIVCAQKSDSSSTGIRQQSLSLSFANNGQRLTAEVGQQIEMTLGIVGPRQYDTPQVSGPAIRLETIELTGPQNPGGPTYVYIFQAALEGEAQVKIPVVNTENPDEAKRLTFAVTIRVRSAHRDRLALQALTDQANIAPWDKAWTNLLNDVRQTFKPSLPRLIRIEVELVVANAGPTEGEVVMSVQDKEGEVLALVSRTVAAADCGHVLFIFPNGGLQLYPGQVYSIRLSGGSLFGWKYVVGGYPSGAATFNGRPLLPEARSTFLFRTFGAS